MLTGRGGQAPQVAGAASGSAGTRGDDEDGYLAGLPDDTIVNTEADGIEVDFRRPGSKLLIERDAPGHERPRTSRQDAERDAALQAAGYEVRRVRRT